MQVQVRDATSAFSIRLIVEYVRRCGGDAAVERLFAGLTLDGPVDRLHDEHTWFSWDDKLRLLDRGAEVLGTPNFAFEAAQHAMDVQVGGWLKSSLRSFGTPSAIFRRVVQINGQISKVARLELVSIRGTEAVIRRRVPVGYARAACDCNYAAGLIASVPTLFGYPPAYIQETRCARRGDEYCEYRVRWREARPLAPLFGLLAAVGGLSTLPLLSSAEAAPWFGAAYVAALIVGGLLAGFRYDDARRLEFQRDVLREQRQALEREYAAGLALLDERRRSQQETASAFLRLASAAGHMTDIDELLRQVVTVLPPLVGCDRCGIWLLDEGAGEFRPASLCSPRPDGDVLFAKAVVSVGGDHAFNRAVEQDAPLVVNDANQTLIPEFVWRIGQFKSFAVAPLRGQRAALGVLMVDRFAEEHRFTEEDLAIVGAVAGHTAVVIENARLYAEASARADRDPLTDLGNHGYFHRRLEAEIARARREHAPLSVLMMDLDGFKDVNDEHGHLFGDDVLRIVAAAIRDACRQGDVVTRYGGDEFAAILVGAGEDDARLIAGRIRERLVDRFADLPAGAAGPVGISIGAASLGETTATATSLLGAADRALYGNKPPLPRPVPFRRPGA